tara:strand:+ start:248 stop:718 length:471 start_codon:yes stop_codon:yes gene_type:complete
MSDKDMLRRGDVLKAIHNALVVNPARDEARKLAGFVVSALPAVQPDARIKEYEDAYRYALHLAEALRENYPPNPDFRFLGDLAGLLTQIDNMVAGLSQPDREYVAFRMWKAEADRAAPNVGKNRTLDGFRVAAEAEREKWLGLADAAIRSMKGETP